MSIILTARERAFLKGKAHALEPCVHVGQSGVTDAVVRETENALTAHELIKVKIAASGREDREAQGNDLCVRTGAAAVQRVGKVLVLWRPREEEDADE